MSAPMQQTTLPSGLVVALSDQGAGDPILFLHGVLMSSVFFEHNLEQFARNRRVLALDFRGHGQSPPVDGGHLVEQYAQDVHELLVHLDLHAVTVVGWSMGALVAWEYLLQHPEDSRIARHVVVSQGPSDFTQADWPYGIADLAGVVGLHRAVQADVRGFLDGFIPLMLAEKPSSADHRRLLDSIAVIEANTASAILVDQTLVDYRSRVKELAVPHLLVWGTDEKVIAHASGTWLWENLPDSTLTVIEDTGHCPMWENPSAFAEVVQNWLDAQL
ncbi:MAG: alpha/beta fold hydrolase [Propioniciclava sp.]